MTNEPRLAIALSEYLHEVGFHFFRLGCVVVRQRQKDVPLEELTRRNALNLGNCFAQLTRKGKKKPSRGLG
jgi:hypothetical protein